MTVVHIVYHQEGASWWAEGPDIDGFTAGDSLVEARRMAREGVSFYLDNRALDIREQLADGGTVSDYVLDPIVYERN